MFAKTKKSEKIRKQCRHIADIQVFDRVNRGILEMKKTEGEKKK